MTTEHILQTPWVFWFESGKNSEKSTNITTFGEKLVTIKSIEEFWGFYDIFPSISRVLKGSDSHFFREGINPTQSDSENNKGCRFVFTFDMKTDEQVTFIEKLWEKLLKYCIGEIFTFREVINGISFSMRSQGRITLWVNTQENNKHIDFVNAFKSDFGIDAKCKLYDHKNPLQAPVEM